jgi:hypothetical protein
MLALPCAARKLDLGLLALNTQQLQSARTSISSQKPPHNRIQCNAAVCSRKAGHSSPCHCLPHIRLTQETKGHHAIHSHSTTTSRSRARTPKHALIKIYQCNQTTGRNNTKQAGYKSTRAVQRGNKSIPEPRPLIPDGLGSNPRVTNDLVRSWLLLSHFFLSPTQ